MRVVCYELNMYSYKKEDPALLDVELPQVMEGMIIEVNGKFFINLEKTTVFVFKTEDRGGGTELSHIEMGFVPYYPPLVT